MAALDDAAFSAALGARPSTLLELADSARLGGRPGRARDALLAARARHHVTGSTAFLLGKVSADQLKSSADALRWFETYLAEQPSGVFAEQALARILEIHSAGPGDGARAAASRYLAAHPNGSRAALARSVLER
ncbi:MAG: hypothetical protein IPG04_34065 [Polyangiaceae bacterium]|nr:hypothetical protein [Polyangiaceae bacterium]